MKKIRINILIGILVIGIGIYFVFRNRSLISLINNPESATYCLIIDDNIKFVQDTTLSSGETAQLIGVLKDVTINCPVPYGSNFLINPTEPLYRLFFSSDNVDLGIIIINGNYAYDRFFRYKITSTDIPLINSLINSFFVIKTES